MSSCFMVEENEPIYANIEVLSQKSDYFAAKFRCNMRESIERTVTVPDCSKSAFMHVLRCLYMDGFTVNHVVDAGVGGVVGIGRNV